MDRSVFPFTALPAELQVQIFKTFIRTRPDTDDAANQAQIGVATATNLLIASKAVYTTFSTVFYNSTAHTFDSAEDLQAFLGHCSKTTFGQIQHLRYCINGKEHPPSWLVYCQALEALHKVLGSSIQVLETNPAMSFEIAMTLPGDGWPRSDPPVLPSLIRYLVCRATCLLNSNPVEKLWKWDRTGIRGSGQGAPRTILRMRNCYPYVDFGPLRQSENKVVFVSTYAVPIA